MKKTLIASALLLLTITASAQDTIVLKDGSRFLVKILNMDADGVHYKIWTNLDGPTWTKSYTSIKFVKRQGVTATKSDTPKPLKLDFSRCGEPVPTENKKKDKAKKQKEKPCITGDEIVRTIDSIYRGDRNNTAAAWRDIPLYINGLPSCIKRQCIEEYYLNQFNNAVTSKNENGIIYFGEIYLYVGGESELPMVSSVLATIFASRGNEQATNTYIDKLKQYSAQNDNMLDEDITKLQKETYALLHPRRLEDDMKGKWVLLEKISYKGFSDEKLYSPFILEIKNVRKETGAHILLSQQEVPKQKNMITPSLAYNKQINTSQALLFDGNNRYAAIQFASVLVKDRRGNTDLAHTILESNRDTRAQMNATIISSKASIEDKLAASVMTVLYTGAVDILARSLNTSSKTDEVYNMVLFPKNDNVMNAYVSYVSVTTTTTERGNPNSVYNENIKDKRMQLVRWEESDSIFFVSKNRQPITLSSISANSTLLEEYYQIKRKYSLSNPKILVPFVALNVVGVIMIRKGIKTMNDVMPGEGDKYMNGLGISSIGVLAFTIGDVAIPSICVNKQKKIYMDINRRNIEKLRQKASASVAVAPTYEPQYNTFGASVKLSF